MLNKLNKTQKAGLIIGGIECVAGLGLMTMRKHIKNKIDRKEEERIEALRKEAIALKILSEITKNKN